MDQSFWQSFGISLLLLFCGLTVWRLYRQLKLADRRLAEEMTAHEQLRNDLVAQQALQLDQTERELLSSRQQYHNLFERTADALMLLDKGAFTDGNPACLKLFDCKDKNEFLGSHPSEFSPPYQEDGQDSRSKANLMIGKALEKGSYRFEWLHQTKQGKIFPAEVLLTVLSDEAEPLIYAIVRDITVRKQTEIEIRYQAYYDTLTGLPNRRLMLDRISQALLEGKRHGNFNALLFVDLDRFKLINDSLGHSIGDQLLVQVSDLLKSNIREADTVARFGGDEFVLLLKHLGTEKTQASLRAERLCEALHRKISKAYDIEGHSVHVTASIGIHIFPNNEESLDDIIKQADTAMYSAKDSGRNRIAFFHVAMQEAIIKRLNLEKDLRKAVQNGELTLNYQPQIAADKSIFGVEALVRWIHPEHGFVSPEDFVAIAEESGIILDLGEFVLRQSIKDILSLPVRPNHLSVNISPCQFRSANFVEMITELMKEHQLPAGFLALEITEGVVIENLEETVAKLAELQSLGIRLSLDDFGTGYSSLSYLKRLPIDELKIDRAFVSGVEDDPHDALLVQTIINIAHQFKLTTVAEGVETDGQLNFLRRFDCRVYQGYYYSRPLPFEELKAFIEGFQAF